MTDQPSDWPVEDGVLSLGDLLRTLEAAPQYQGEGKFSAEPAAALHAFGHIYAGWGLSQPRPLLAR